eukprot:1156039-Pelagomonas_calceolata.AAC.11
MSDSCSDSRDSSISDTGCSSSDEQEPAQKKQASEPITVASKALQPEFWARLESKGGNFKCPQ